MLSIVVKNFQGVSVESKNFTIEKNLKNISDFKQILGESFKIKHFDLVRRGLCLKDEQLLEALHLKEGDTLYTLKSPRRVEHVAESVDGSTFKHVVKSMTHLLSKASTRNLLETKMKSRDLLECIIEAVPAFGQDSIAMDVLSCPALLMPIFSKKNSEPAKFLAEHPSMIHACLILIEEVKGEIGVGHVDASRQDPKALFNIDQMSDQEEEMETDDDDDDDPGESSSTAAASTENPIRRVIRNYIRPFGTHIGASTSTNPPSNAISNPPSNPPSNPITTDFFRQAMMAINSTVNPPPAHLNPSPQSDGTANALPVSEAQVRQLMELGNIDASLATNLLRQTSGDLDAAIALYLACQEFNI